MTLNGKVSVDQEVKVVKPKGVTINLTDAGEIRRLGRILLSFLATSSEARGTRTDRFASDLVAAIGFDAANTAKQ